MCFALGCRFAKQVPPHPEPRRAKWKAAPRSTPPFSLTTSLRASETPPKGRPRMPRSTPGRPTPLSLAKRCSGLWCFRRRQLRCRWRRCRHLRLHRRCGSARGLRRLPRHRLRCRWRRCGHLRLHRRCGSARGLRRLRGHRLCRRWRRCKFRRSFVVVMVHFSHVFLFAVSSLI